MKDSNNIPRILIIDDLFGRTHKDRRNQDRESLCGLYLLKDITGYEEGKVTSTLKIKKPVAEAVFFRGQKPICSTVGDTVENDLEVTLKVIADGWNKPPYWSLVLLDLCFYTGRVTEESNKKNPGMPEGRPGDDDPKQYFGLRILEKIKDNFPTLPVIILSSKPEKDVSLDYTSLGALGFIDRASKEGPKQLAEYLDTHGLTPDHSGKIIGQSKALLFALREIRMSSVPGVQKNILFRGETGTGKRLFAEYAHEQMAKADKSKERPFIVVNCPQISSELFASELFGHRKGAFTDADKDKIGLIEKADGGDVFLDEIANLPLEVQAGILKVIEEKEFTRLGETNIRNVNVRFLSATNANIELKIANGQFREDLLFRLSEGGTIFLPSLRDRKEDIQLLVERLVRAYERQLRARERVIEPAAIKKLMSYDWPGNVRELQGCIYKAVKNNPRVPHLVSDHIQFKDEMTSGKGSLVSIPREVQSVKFESTFSENKSFEEKQLPSLLMEQNRNIVNYILQSLEIYRDKSNDEPNYPQTWMAMTGDTKKRNSSEYQRFIGNYIFQLSDEDIVSLMKQSKVFQKAVFQCGSKVQSAKKRLAGIRKMASNEIEN